MSKSCQSAVKAREKIYKKKVNSCRSVFVAVVVRSVRERGKGEGGRGKEEWNASHVC